MIFVYARLSLKLPKNGGRGIKFSPVANITNTDSRVLSNHHKTRTYISNDDDDGDDDGDDDNIAVVEFKYTSGSVQQQKNISVNSKVGQIPVNSALYF